MTATATPRPRVLLQTTIPYTEDDWHVGRFSLLRDEIAKVAKAYGAYYEAVMQDSQVAGNYYTVNHSAYIYLIDPQGRYALLYNNDKLTDHARMQADIEHLLAAPAR